MSRTLDIDMRVFPPDVQDLLRDRAVAQRRRIEDVVREFALEVGDAVCAAAGGPRDGTDLESEDAA